MPSPDASKQTPLATLMWLVESGADETIGEIPVDRQAVSVPQAGPTIRRPLRTPLTPQPAVPPPSSVDCDAQRLADEASSLEQLKINLERFEGCALKASATNTVFADGNPQSGIMLIGEAPGRDEDRIGKPFVGKAGQLLDKMLAAIGRDRNTVYITNVLNWRPPDNREPTPEEAASLLPFLRKHIALVAPRVLVLLGAVAAHHVLGGSEGIMRLRGTWKTYRDIPALPMFHPAFLLRQPIHKKLAWQDLLALKERIG